MWAERLSSSAKTVTAVWRVREPIDHRVLRTTVEGRSALAPTASHNGNGIRSRQLLLRVATAGGDQPVTDCPLGGSPRLGTRLGARAVSPVSALG